MGLQYSAAYLGTGGAVAHVVGPVQHDLPVQHTHAIPEQGRLGVALILGALVSPFQQPLIPS